MPAANEARPTPKTTSQFDDKDLWPTLRTSRADHPQTEPAELEAPSSKSERAEINAIDENTVIRALDQLGYIYYNSFDHDPDGTAIIRAIYRKTGELRTLHIKPSGTIDISPGWKQ